MEAFGPLLETYFLSFSAMVGKKCAKILAFFIQVTAYLVNPIEGLAQTQNFKTYPSTTTIIFRQLS